MLTLALSLGFVSCDDYDLPNPPAQSNPQEPMFDASAIELVSIASPETIDLIQINDADALVPLAEVVSIKGLEGYTAKYVGQMSASESFSNPVNFDVEVKDNKIYANPDDLDAAYHQALSTVAPNARETNIRFTVYAENDKSRIRIGEFGALKATMKPFDPGFTVEEKYYLIGTATNGLIDKATAIEMHNSGASPYDDPVFTAVIDITSQQAADGYQWAVVPESTMSAGSGVVMAPSDEALADMTEGYLTDYTSADVFAIVSEENKHLFTVNVKADEDGLYSYKVELAIPNLWTPGPSNDWNQGASQLLYTDNYVFYQGYVHIDSEFKFTSAPDWAHTNFGYAADGKLSTDGGAGNMKTTQDGTPLTNGLYWCTADIVALTYTATPINSFGIIGDATDGGWDSETKMTPSEDFMTWTVTTTLKEGTFKFRANDNWDINLGGALEALTPGADNIPVSTGQTGTVTITLNLATITDGVSWYTATITQ